MNRYPIRFPKVQPPSLRDDTLSRERLLDWLAAKIHDRVVLVLADAGYGKTTLLADFARRSRLKTLWYRLEEDDRDWVAFLNHLVAAGREHDPSFAPTTSAILGDLSVGGTTRDAAIDVFLRELPSAAAHGAMLILDDFHLVDDSPDVRLIARELVARAPERMSIVFASRRPPTIPLARLRASGEVAELGTDDLRFDASETSRLFAEAYGRALEPDVLADVVARTEGWAASLQLVQAALRDRSPAEIRRFVRGLTGADQELYDYLAEEVVGDLPEDLQQFLMRTAILQTVSPELAEVVTELDAANVSRVTAAAERLTLLTRPSRDSSAGRRYHPLVREFLEARLRLTAGEQAVAGLHRRAAQAAGAFDWRVAAHHWRAAGDMDGVAAAVAGAVPAIMGSGQYATADEFISQVPVESWSPGLKLIRSRVELQRGDYDRALALSNEVLESSEPGSTEGDHALLNLVTTNLHAGNATAALGHARRLEATSENDQLRLIAEGTAMLVASSGDGDVSLVAAHLLDMAQAQRDVHPHYYGVSMLNLAIISILRDDPRLAIGYANEAIGALQETSSTIEFSSALMTKAAGLAILGDDDAAQGLENQALALGQTEAILERADLADSFGDPMTSWPLLDGIEVNQLNATDRLAFALQCVRFYVRRARHIEATKTMDAVEPRIVGLYPGQQSERQATAAYAAAAMGAPEARQLADEAFACAKHQGAHRWRRVAALLRAYHSPDTELSGVVTSLGAESPWTITYVADLVADRLDGLSQGAVDAVASAAVRHPARWRFVLRPRVAGASVGQGVHAARILETIGERSDVRLLRTYARKQRRLRGASALGRALARRLADHVYVEDQNRVAIRVGQRLILGTSVRRKVLGLLCFLLTKPELASTRDQVLDALWPDLDPVDAVNSLNQTVYFLRRVLEEDYVDDLSPGYLHHDSDLIWLDSELVKSRSNECRKLIKALPLVPSPDAVGALAEEYQGRFALDFEYEEWAAPFRDWLHAAFLEVVERSVTADIESGHFDRGIGLARKVLDVDPSAEQVEASLLRLYRSSGAHAAAAEQYSHYAEVMRSQFGVEPPPLEAV